MVETFETITRRTLRSQLSFRVNDRLAEGTATAGGAATLTDAGNLAFQEADLLKGAWIFIHTGTSSGDLRWIQSSTTAGVVTVSENWTATPDTTSQYEVHRKFQVSHYNDVIDAAFRADRQAHLGLLQDISLLTNGVLQNALFTEWANGVSSAPDNWTLAGSGTTHAVAQESSIRRRGPYGAKLTNELNKTLTFSQATSRSFKGDTLTAKALIHCSTASRVTIKTDDGVSTASSSSAHGGSGWELLTVEHAVAPTVLIPSVTHSVEISTGALIDCVIDSFFVPSVSTIREYAIPSNFRYFHKLQHEPSTPQSGDTDSLAQSLVTMLLGEEYEVAGGSVSPTATIRLKRYPGENRVLYISGTGYPKIPTSDTDRIQINTELVILKAASILTREDRFERDYQTLREQTRVSFPANSVPVGVSG